MYSFMCQYIPMCMQMSVDEYIYILFTLHYITLRYITLPYVRYTLRYVTLRYVTLHIHMYSYTYQCVCKSRSINKKNIYTFIR